MIEVNVIRPLEYDEDKDMFKVNTQADYYDPYPVVDLDRHLVLIGLCGEETRTVGFRLAGLLGVPAVDLDRLMEHEHGCSVNHLIFEQGEKAYRKSERHMLYRVLSARPFGVISLGDGALMHEGTRAKVSSFSHLIALERDLAGCYWFYRQRQNGSLADWHPFFEGPLHSIEQVKPFFDSRRAVFNEASLRMPASAGASPSDLAKQLYDRLIAA